MSGDVFRLEPTGVGPREYRATLDELDVFATVPIKSLRVTLTPDARPLIELEVHPSAVDLDLRDVDVEWSGQLPAEAPDYMAALAEFRCAVALGELVDDVAVVRRIVDAALDHGD